MLLMSVLPWMMIIQRFHFCINFNVQQFEGPLYLLSLTENTELFTLGDISDICAFVAYGTVW
jgi:hypothetical protein